MKKDLVDLTNNKLKKIDIDENIFGIRTYPDIIHQYIRFQNANAREGNHKTKTRSEVNGRAKKPFSQKGTGNARQGSSKPPNFRGGATSMGPVVRNHSFDLNKKEKKLALKSTLSSKMNEQKIIFIDKLKLENHKTNDLNKKLKKFNFDSALFIYAESSLDSNFKRASANIPKIAILNEKGINVRDLILFDKIFIEEKSIENISKRLL